MKDEFIFREFKPEDETKLIDLWQKCGLTRPWNDPKADIALALKTPTSCIFICESSQIKRHGAFIDAAQDHTILASVMTGFEGHRGWIYYLAVSPENRGIGIGAKLVQHAEEWLKTLECPKVELMIRPESSGAKNFYSRIGYAVEDRLVMAKWLQAPPVPAGDVVYLDSSKNQPAQSAEGKSSTQLDVTITYLEMSKAPTTVARRPPSFNAPLSLLRLQDPTVSYYRYIQHTIGDPWLWYERKKMSDHEIAKIILDEQVEIYVLSAGGCPAGFIELDFRGKTKESVAEIAYLGLFPEFIGKGLGPYLLDWGIRCAWNRSPAPKVLKVNTCTLDHPSALAAYQKAGFTPVSQEHKRIADPRGSNDH